LSARSKLGPARYLGLLLVGLVGGLACGPAMSQPAHQAIRPSLIPPIAVSDLRSGSFYLSDALRAQQADGLQHPAGLSVDRGALRWSKSCEQCHGQAPGNLRGVTARLPRVDERGNV
jgi:hypothetical protein